MDNNIIISWTRANIGRNQFGVTLVTKTEPKMAKTNNPYFGRVTKVKVSTNVALGRDYAAKVNKDLEANGLEGTFKAQKASGRSPLGTDLLFEVNDNNPNICYMRVMYNKNSKTSEEIFLDGVKATPEEVKAIKEFFPKASPSKKQMACGLAEEDCERIVCYKLESIVEIKQGAKVLK